MATLQDSISTIRGIGEKRALAFRKLGVNTLYDLLSAFPARYEDRSVIVPIAEAADGIPCCISAVVADEPRLSRIRRGMELVKFRVFDSSGAADITYFNQSWMKNNICRGEEYIFYGRIESKGRYTERCDRRHCADLSAEPRLDAEKRSSKRKSRTGGLRRTAAGSDSGRNSRTARAHRDQGRL